MSTGMPNDNGEFDEIAQEAYSPPPPEADGGQVNRSVIDAFSERGYDTEAFSNDEQFIQTLEAGLAQLSELPRLKQMAEYGMNQQGDEFTTPEPGSQIQPANIDTGGWMPPEYDDKWDSLLSVDQTTGQFVPVSEHVNPSIAQKANEYRDWLRGQGKNFWRNPYEFMKEGLGDWVQAMVDERVYGAMDQNRVDGNVGSFLEANASRFYELDSNGMPLTNPVTGEEMLTAEGDRLKQHAEYAQEIGIYDSDKIQEYAVGMLERDLYQAQSNPQYYAQQSQQTPQQVNETQKQNFLQSANMSPAPQPYGAGYSPNRNASEWSAAEAGMPQNNNLSFMDMALPELVNMGLVQQTG